MIDRSQNICRLPSRRGFTLVEMLVVIAVIVLAMTLAIPAIRSLTGSRSVEAAENSISAYLAQIRAEAIGQQKTEGVMFLLDSGNDRIMCVPVQDVTNNLDNPQITVGRDDSRCVFLDAIADREPYYLPHGIRLFTTKDQAPRYQVGLIEPNVIHSNDWGDAFPNWRYLGPNTYPVGTTDSSAICYPIGVILFGSDGKLLVTQYGLRLNNGVGGPSVLSSLIYTGMISPPAPNNWPTRRQHFSHYLASQIGLVIVDKEEFLNGGTGFVDHDNPAANEQALDAWLDTNASPILVNRYDGTLMRSE